jgi:thiol-disulfide isomerase/thioredoxin
MTSRISQWSLAALGCLLPGLCLVQPAQAQSEQLVKALSYKPQQADVPFDQVPADKIAACSIEEVTRDEGKGFLVTGENGQVLRWFVDTNGDKRLDRWSYYSQGIETYRELDTNFDGAADEYRWLGTAGMRWGVDKDGDRKIDFWKFLSAEEATFEVVQAAAARDAKRFAALLLSQGELDELGVGDDKAEVLAKKIQDASAQFASWAAGQNVVERDSQWMHFGAEKPGIVPAGTDGSDKDVVVYENVVALLETAGKPQQLMVGTLVQVGQAWRVVDLPRAVTEGAVVSDEGMFFNSGFTSRGQLASAATSPVGGLSKSMERLLTNLQEVDDKLVAASASDRPTLHAQRADVLEKLIAASDSEEDRSTWIKQFADTINAASQTGEYPDGVARLGALPGKLVSVSASPDDLAYVQFRAITAEHTFQIQQANVDFPAVQKAYLTRLERFVNDYPKSEDAPEAMSQIAQSAEMAGEFKEAQAWYGKASAAFPDSIAGKRAAGAIARLNLTGNKFNVKAQTLEGRPFDSASYAGSPVIYHYWASWCEPCKAEMRALKELQSKYAKQKVRVVGINVDQDPQVAKRFLQANPYPWVHVHEVGGLDSKLAVGLGVFTLPVCIVVDGQARVVKSGAHWTELDGILDKVAK